jgi:hypothetical protein
VQFFPISPEKVKRTSPFEGLQSLATIIARRFAHAEPAVTRAHDAAASDHTQDTAMARSRE